MKKNILIISIYYPPIQAIASNRLYSFAKYLNKEKYNVFVHTIDEGKEFNNDLEDVSISRVKNSRLFKPFSFLKRTNKVVHYAKVIYNKIIGNLTKDLYQSWIDESFKLLKLKIKKDNIDLMLSSFSPDASHLLALKLKKEFPHLKWIADMRDEMSRRPGIGEIYKIKYELLEQDIFINADALTSVSKPILDEFKSMCKNNKLVFSEIRNGYDFDVPIKVNRNPIFTIKYIGNFYGDISPINFFKGLELFLINNQDVQLKVQLIGVKTQFKVPKSITNIIEILPSVSHGRAIELMRQSDALLLIHPNNGRKGVFTGKLFEYLGVLKPIIGLIDEGDVASKLIQKCNAGYVSEETNISKVNNIIQLVYHDWKNKTTREIDITEIKKHHRYEQTKRLEVLIDKLLYKK